MSRPIFRSAATIFTGIWSRISGWCPSAPRTGRTSNSDPRSFSYASWSRCCPTPPASCTDQIKLILPVYQSTAKDGVTFHTLIDFLKQNGLEAGISRNTDSLSHLARGNVESVKALEMGQLFHSQECLFFYDKFSVYHALDLCQKNYDVMNFCHSALFILATYDRTHGTSLLDTLHAFLFCHHSLTEAAAKLFIHRNTMNNRMEKIVELTGVDLQDAEAAFHLMFSFHILEYYGATVALDYEQRMRHNPTLRHQ